MSRFAVVAIFKDEAPYLREWIAFHRLQGAGRFTLFNNGSTDDWEAAIEGIPGVDVRWWPGDRQQMSAYADALPRITNTWAAFLDLDEYLWTGSATTVAEYLDGLDVGVSQVLATWRMFGDGGHETRPDGLTIDSYTRAARDLDRRHTKPIVQPRLVSGQGAPHSFSMSSGRTLSHLIVNHYWTRSVEECRAKFAKGRADTGQFRQWREFEATRAEFNEVYEDALPRVWGARLREALA